MMSRRTELKRRNTKGFNSFTENSLLQQLMDKDTEEAKSKNGSEFVVNAGEEMNYINEWTQHKNELCELKKIFFEFLKRWIDSERHKIEPNKPIIYQNASDSEPFELE